MSFHYPALIGDIISPFARSHVPMSALTHNKAAGADTYIGGEKPSYLERAIHTQPMREQTSVNATYRKATNVEAGDRFKAALAGEIDYLINRDPAYATRPVYRLR